VRGSDAYEIICAFRVRAHPVVANSAVEVLIEGSLQIVRLLRVAAFAGMGCCANRSVGEGFPGGIAHSVENVIPEKSGPAERIDEMTGQLADLKIGGEIHKMLPEVRDRCARRRRAKELERRVAG